MENLRLILGFCLLLAVGLWACQDRVVAPDGEGVQLEAALKKPPKPPPDGNTIYLGFQQTPMGPYDFVGDFVADEQTGRGQITDGWVRATFPDFQLTLDLQGELDEGGMCREYDPQSGECVDWLWWCWTNVCVRGKCRALYPTDADFVNSLQILQDISTRDGFVVGELDVDGADVRFTTDYPEGQFVFRAYGVSAHGTVHPPVWDGTHWVTTVEKTSFFPVNWTGPEKHAPTYSTRCSFGGWEEDWVDYQYFAK